MFQRIHIIFRETYFYFATVNFSKIDVYVLTLYKILLMYIYTYMCVCVCVCVCVT